MGTAQRIIFLLFSFTLAFGQRIPQSFFEPVAVTPQQQSRIVELDSISEKSEEDYQELAFLYAATKSYEQSYELLETLVESHPENFQYQYLLGGVSGIIASELPRVKSLPYVRTMKSAFEAAADLRPNTIEVQLVLLELYAELPWVLGGSNKKAQNCIEIIKSLSSVEGFLAEGYFYRTIKKNKEALVAYLNAVNETQSCDFPLNTTNNAYYHLAVCAYYLQKDMPKAACLFSEYLKRHSGGDMYPKSFATYYLKKTSNQDSSDPQMEAVLKEYDNLTAWIQNNFK